MLRKIKATLQLTESTRAYHQTGKIGREESQIRLDDKADLILHIKQVAQRDCRLHMLDEGLYALRTQSSVMMRSTRTAPGN